MPARRPDEARLEIDYNRMPTRRSKLLNDLRDGMLYGEARRLGITNSDWWWLLRDGGPIKLRMPDGTLIAPRIGRRTDYRKTQMDPVPVIVGLDSGEFEDLNKQLVHDFSLLVSEVRQVQSDMNILNKNQLLILESINEIKTLMMKALMSRITKEDLITPETESCFQTGDD